MEPEPIEQVVRNIDQRLSKVERILPTLPTKQEMADAIAPLATKAELREAVAPLAKKTEFADAVKGLEAKIDQQAVETRRHFDVVAEGIEHQIKLLAEGIAGTNERMDRRFEAVEKNVAGLDRRVLTLEAGRRRRTR